MADGERPSLPARLIGAALGLLGIYLTLVVANLGLAEAMRAFNNEAAEDGMRAVMERRRTEEDPPLIAAARADGYQPLVVPGLIDNAWRFPGMKAVAEETRRPLIGGLPNVDNYYCNEGYGLVRYRADRFGLRNADALWDDVAAVDVLAIGDSFVHGACVGDDETIPARLTALGLPTVNVAMGGNHPGHYAFLARLFAPAVRPRHLAMFFYANDNLNGMDRRNVEGGVYIDLLDGGDDLSGFWERDGDRLQPSPSLRAAFQNFAQTAEATVFGGKAKKSLWDHVTRGEYWGVVHARVLVESLLADRRATDPLAKRAIDEAMRQCATVGCAPLIVWIPNSEAAAPDPGAADFKAMLEAYVAEAGAPYLDLTAALAPMGDTAYAVRGQHLSPEGYAVAADAVAGALVGR